MENVIGIVHSSERKEFLKKVYLHLIMAILTFVGLEYLWFTTPVAELVMDFIVGKSWMFILGPFMGAAWLASRLAESKEDIVTQYIGLVLYTFAESLIFIPLLYIAQYQTNSDIIGTAGYLTVSSFIALTGVVFLTKVDLLGWGKYILWSGIVALCAVLCSVLFGFNLGILFSSAMVCLAGCAILYDTSMIIHHYDNKQYVSASLQLFASIAMMFWYILSILNKRK